MSSVSAHLQRFIRYRVAGVGCGDRTTRNLTNVKVKKKSYQTVKDSTSEKHEKKLDMGTIRLIFSNIDHFLAPATRCFLQIDHNIKVFILTKTTNLTHNSNQETWTFVSFL